MKLDKAYSSQELNGSGVYQILNKVNNKRYIGSSICLRVRRNQHINKLRKNKHANKKLQYSFNKYTEEAFEFSILELTERKEVRFKEQFYLDKLKPQLNISSKADALLCPRLQEKAASKNRKRYYLINPEGIQMCTDNLKEFCIEHNILRDNIAHLLVEGKSARNFYKGWFITTDPLELKEENRYSVKQWRENNTDNYRQARAEYTTYIWNTKTNQQYIIGNVANKTHLTLHSFCKEFNLTKESIRTAFNKNKKNYKQFVIYREYKHLQQPTQDFLDNYYLKNKGFKVRKERKSPYIYTAISPNNKTYTIKKDLKTFCEKHNLDRSAFVKVSKGVLNQTKGWKITRKPI